MEIRDPVHGSISLSENEEAVINSTEFQRLRAIKQLGFSEISFPGATHNRYLHSIGVSHLAGLAFDLTFKTFPFASASRRGQLRSCFKLAAMLHDVGHGPLSHTTEEVMPPLRELNVKVYQQRNSLYQLKNGSLNVRANHEDYTIKYITDSPLTGILQKSFPDFSPIHVACLIDKTLKSPDDFFIESGKNMRPILSQLVSSELDVDRMDYLERDSYFCGTNYGKVDLHWILNNLTYYEKDQQLYLALNRRALYTFDDFLISRHHMHLMVYFHHKSIVYEEMLNRYLTSKDCTFSLPSDINEYTRYHDYRLHEHLANSKNEWAQRIAFRKPYKVLVELHTTGETDRPEKIKSALQAEGFDVIWASSSARLSKYHSVSDEDRALQIYVLDQYDRSDSPVPISDSTQIFSRYEGTRIIDRLYVAPENYLEAEKFLNTHKL